MNLKIKGHHLPLTPALREYVHTKLGAVVQNFPGQVVGSTVTLGFEKVRKKSLRYSASIVLCIKGKTFPLVEKGSDMYAAIDALMSRLSLQMVEHKSRQQDFACLATSDTKRLHAEIFGEMMPA